MPTSSKVPSHKTPHGWEQARSFFIGFTDTVQDILEPDHCKLQAAHEDRLQEHLRVRADNMMGLAKTENVLKAHRRYISAYL